jgi:hypothetical protein
MIGTLIEPVSYDRMATLWLLARVGIAFVVCFLLLVLAAWGQERWNARKNRAWRK